MSNKHVIKAWGSEEDLLNDAAVIPRSLHSGDERMLDEDTLLAVDEAGIRSSSDFTNNSQYEQDYQSEEMSGMNAGDGLTNYGDVSEFVGVITDEGAAQEGGEDIHVTDLEGEQKAGNGDCANGSDVENLHDGEKNKVERKGVISLTPTTRRDSIPEKLEINKEQAAQLKQFLSDKSHRGRGRGTGQGRPGSKSLLGQRPNIRYQQNSQMILGQFLQGVLGPQPRMGFPFQGGQPARGPFPVRPLNRAPFPGQPQNRPLQSSPALNLQRGRFPGSPNQRGAFIGQQPPLVPQRMPTGLSPNQLRLQGFPNQRMANASQFRQQSPLMGQQGIRLPGARGPRPLIGNSLQRPLIGNSGPRSLLGNAGPRPLLGSAGSRPLIRNPGPRPLMGNPRPDMRFVHPNQSSGNPHFDQSNLSIVNQVANALQSSLGFQQMRPQQNSLMQNAGPGLIQNRFQQPTGQMLGSPRFMGRNPGVGGPFANSGMFRGNQQPLLGGQRMPMFGNNVFMNPRFQGPQGAFGATGMGKGFRMGVPPHQRRAKMLLDRAKQTQNRHVGSAPAKIAGVKRKSTSGEDVPNKVGKGEEKAMETS